MESILFGCDVEEEKFRRSEWFFSMVATQLPALDMKLIRLAARFPNNKCSAGQGRECDITENMVFQLFEAGNNTYERIGWLSCE